MNAIGARDVVAPVENVATQVDEAAVIRKVCVRLIPLVALLYFMNCIDRANVGMAALTMNKALSLSGTQFGIGSGIFFFGYVLCEIPSNVILEKMGARYWIPRILVVWGLVSAGTAFIIGPTSFYITRLVLGVAEAGFFPGMVFYLTLWFPAAYRARMIGMFMVAIPLASAIGSPLSGWIMDRFHGAGDLQGWQWMFIFEGLPTVLLGLGCFYWLTDRPAKATWLTPAERDWLEGVLLSERKKSEDVRKYTLLQGLLNSRVLLLCLLFFFICAGLYGSVFWIPQLVKTFVKSDTWVGAVTSIPYFIAAVAMCLWSRHSDKSGERIWHLIACTGVGAIGFLITGFYLNEPIVAVIGLSLACMGIYSTYPVFWTLPTSILTGRSLAAAIAWITGCAASSGIVAPAAVGWSKDVTGNFRLAMLGLAGAMILAGLLCLVFKSLNERIISRAKSAALTGVL
jgi:ACS family tartrate transporter-like MFS transporter